MGEAAVRKWRRQDTGRDGRWEEEEGVRGERKRRN